MSSPKKPRKPPKPPRIRHSLHQRVQYERSQPRAGAAEARLRSLLGLPTQQERAK